jgi:hypothetical protein
MLWVVASTGCGPSGPRKIGSPRAASEGTPFALREEAAKRGLSFHHTYGDKAPITIVEGMGSGCALFDFDQDGDLDAFLVNAGQDHSKALQASASRLYRNDGHGRFEDVTPASGIRFEGYGMGCCVGDYDADGRDDLFVSGFGGCRLYRNFGHGKFQDVTKKVGLQFPRGFWGTGCAFLDINQDTCLDLYVASYVRYDPKVPYCQSGGVTTACSPNQYGTQANLLFVNLGNGHFAECAKSLGADDPDGAGLGVLTADFNADGKTDLFIANDGTPNVLLQNAGGKFRNVADRAGVAFAGSGVMRAGMGVDAADYDGDGRCDFAISNYQFEPISLYRNEGAMLFTDAAQQSGMGSASAPRLKFGLAFVDLDRDGLPDLYSGAGHVQDNISEVEKGTTFEQLDQVFENMGKGQLREVPAGDALPLTPSVTRGVAVGDVNNDGSPDLLTNNLGRPARLLVNQQKDANRWLGLDLRGKGGNFRALGARIEVKTPLGRQLREVRSGGSYLSQSDFRQLFGLGSVHSAADVRVLIHWPNGQSQSIQPMALNQYLKVTQAVALGNSR